MKAVKWIALPLLAIYGAWSLFEWHWYLGIIPQRVGTSYPIHISGQSDLREGCGVAVFRLDRTTVRKIEAEGVRFLNTARQSRKSKDAYHTFEEWKPTPRPSDVDNDKSLLSYGLMCSSAGPSLSRQLDEAVRAPGSFYAFGPEKVLVVIPSRRIVVLSWYG